MVNMFLMKLWPPRSLLSRCVCPSVTAAGCVSVLTLGRLSLLHTQPPQLNSNRTVVVRCGRQKYDRLYPVMLVRPDGSTVNIRYKEPRRILMMPVNVSSLSEEERRARRKRREVKKAETQAEDHYEEDFSSERYSHLWKKK